MTQPANRPPRRERPRGGGGSGWSPMPSSSSRDREDEKCWLQREIDMIEHALHEHGELSRGALGKAVGRKWWGPGRFGPAVREALRRLSTLRARADPYSRAARP